jgi:hypothetical protein
MAPIADTANGLGEPDAVNLPVRFDEGRRVLTPRADGALFLLYNLQLEPIKDSVELFSGGEQVPEHFPEAKEGLLPSVYAEYWVSRDAQFLLNLLQRDALGFRHRDENPD